MDITFSILSIALMYLPIILTVSKDNEIKMIVDVVQSFYKPSNVEAYLCWKPFKKKQLMSSLAALNNPKTIRFLFTINEEKIVSGETVIFLVDLTCPGFTNILEKANSRRGFNKPYRWFLLGRPVAEGLPSELDDIQILPDSEVYVSQFVKNNSYTVNQVYQIRRGRNWILEHYGLWSTSGIVRSRLMEVPAAMRRKNLAGETVVTSVVITDHSTILDLHELRYPLIDSVSKSLVQQLLPLYDFMNATRGMIYAKTWGYYINGSWSGMLGDISEGRAELAGTLLFITEQRMQIQEYLTYPTPIELKFIFREPPLSYQNNLYLLPFKVSVWYCCGSFVLIMIVIILGNAQWEARKMRIKKDKKIDNTALIPSVSDVTVFVVSAITQQGSAVELKGTLGRLVIFILFLAFLFLYTAYSASIVVLLQSSSNQIRTLADLLQSKLELGVEDTPYNRFWFSAAKEPIRKAIYEKKIAPKGTTPRFYSTEEGIRMMQTKPFAFHVNLGVGYRIMEQYFHEHEKCGLQVVPFIQNNSPWSSCYKWSPYKEIFKIGLLRIHEHGLNHRINQLIYTKKPTCSVRGGRFVSVSIVDCYPTLLVLLYGMILAVFLLSMEILYHKRRTVVQKLNSILF